MAVGHTAKHIEEILLDFMLYPAIIAWLGAVKGGAIMMAFSALMCLLYLRFYDWAGKDLFGFELLKEVRDGGAKKGRFARFAQWVIQKGDWLTFLFLSCYMDPFMTTVDMRRGAGKYNGLSKRDWKIFWGSVVVANLWWTVLMTLAVTSARSILHSIGLT
jgi:hypothetical protein